MCVPGYRQWCVCISVYLAKRVECVFKCVAGYREWSVCISVYQLCLCVYLAKIGVPMCTIVFVFVLCCGCPRRGEGRGPGSNVQGQFLRLDTAT